MKHAETKIYGQHACRAVYEQRPDQIVRVLLTEKCSKEFGDLLRWLAAGHKTYRVVPPEELEKFCGARHHEGICVVAANKVSRPLAEIVEDPGAGQILALDQVGNPHNIGTLLRSAVHFGARAVLLGGPLKRLSAAGYRTAEGAAEFVDLHFAEELGEMLEVCRGAGYSICATSSHEGESLYDVALPARSVIVLGAERAGLGAELIRSADRLLSIPGTERVESLNVASSAAVLMAEHWRQFA